MSDFYIKPGNKERGWNDPPQFSYGVQSNTGGQKRNLLNKRVPPPQLSAPSPVSASPSSPTVNPVPPCHSAPPPVAGFTPPPKGPVPSCRVEDSSSRTQSDVNVPAENEPNLSHVQEPLARALCACRQSVKKQVCDDVERRLKIFDEMWRSGKLSLPVKCRMHGLSQELSKQNWDKADEIHRALMVDYVNEVNQWMVGVKRLIAEARTLSPELLHTEASPEAEVSAPDPMQ